MARLRDAIADRIIAAMNPTPDASVEADIRAKMEMIAEEIVGEITGHAEVDVSTTGTTGAGPPGGPLPITSQPGSGGIT